MFIDFFFHHTKSIRLIPNGFSFYGNQETESVSNLIIANQPVMLIPKQIFQSDHIIDYLRLQFPIENDAMTFSEELGPYQALYYLSQKEITNLALPQLPDTIVHEYSLIYQYCIQHLNVKDNISSLAVSANEGFLDIIAFQNDIILYANRITYSDELSLIYLISNLLNQLNLSISQLHCYLFDFTLKENKIITILSSLLHPIELIHS